MLSGPGISIASRFSRRCHSIPLLLHRSKYSLQNPLVLLQRRRHQANYHSPFDPASRRALSYGSTCLRTAHGTFPGPRCLDRRQHHPNLASSRNIAKLNPLGSRRIWTSKQRAVQPWFLHGSLTRGSGGTHPTIYMRSRVRLPISDHRPCQRVQKPHTAQTR